MRGVADLGTYFKRIFDTPGGREVLGKLERQADEKDRRIARRRELAEKIAEAKRIDREDVPKLEALTEQADAELEVARAVFEKARSRREDTGAAAHRLHMRCYEDVRTAEGELRRTCDPRLVEIEDRLGDERRDWDRTWDKLAIREIVGEFMDAYTRIVNEAQLDALHQGLLDATDAVEKFKLVPVPEEDEVLRVIARGEAALDAIRAAGGGSGREVVR